MIPIPDIRRSEGSDVRPCAPGSAKRHTFVRSRGTDGELCALKSAFLHLSRPEAAKAQEADSIYVPGARLQEALAIMLPAQSKY